MKCFFLLIDVDLLIYPYECVYEDLSVIIIVNFKDLISNSSLSDKEPFRHTKKDKNH